MSVLYGSLGLEKATRLNFSPQDIDILFPLKFLNEKWYVFKHTIEKLGYILSDLQEHEFQKQHIKMGFNFTEDLLDFAKVDYKSLQMVEDEGVKYYMLTIADYQKVYKWSLKDGYRRENNNEDNDKFRVLNQLI